MDVESVSKLKAMHISAAHFDREVVSCRCSFAILYQINRTIAKLEPMLTCFHTSIVALYPSIYDASADTSHRLSVHHCSIGTRHWRHFVLPRLSATWIPSHATCKVNGEAVRPSTGDSPLCPLTAPSTDGVCPSKGAPSPSATWPPPSPSTAGICGHADADHDNIMTMTMRSKIIVGVGC